MIQTDAAMRLRPVVAVVAAFLLVLGIDVWPGSVEPPTPHLPHTVSAGAGHDLAGGFDHPHLQADSSLPDPGEVASAILPRINAPLGAAALAGLAFAIVVGLVCAVSFPVRGPPRGMAAVMTGRQLLTSLAVFRR